MFKDDMGFGGSEWMLDWYDANYYKHSPTHNPQGPETGDKKVLRGSTNSSIHAHSTVDRFNRAIDGKSYWDSMIRCVVNSPQPVKL